MPKTTVRIEHDLLGKYKVPNQALYGIQTARALDNFPAKGFKTIGEYPRLIEAMLIIKKAGAITNSQGKFISLKKVQAIVKAADRLLSQPKPDQFPVHYLHGGSGTSLNMNVNEIIANLAEESLGGQRGQYRLIHPNDDVNKHQSTNDVVPTAAHIAIINQWKTVRKSLDDLTRAWLNKAKQYQAQPRISRTHWQDALQTSYADLFGGYAGFSRRLVKKIDLAVRDLYQVSLGGTAVGNSKDIPKAYFDRVIVNLRLSAKDKNYQRMKNLYDASQHPDQMIAVGNELELLARGLIKIAKDLRALNSGPEAGLSEIHLPAVQPGSSIMPGKVNPVIPEFVIQSCFQVCGQMAAVRMAMDHGELDLNVWRMLIITNILDSLDLMDKAVQIFIKKSVNGLKVDAKVNNKHANAIIAQLTELSKKYGYARVNKICGEGKGDVDKIRKSLGKLGQNF